jgi:hypothetical protein
LGDPGAVSGGGLGQAARTSRLGKADPDPMDEVLASPATFPTGSAATTTASVGHRQMMARPP